MSAYYNENDPFLVLWLKELIKEGAIPFGEVDSRSIKDVPAGDLKGFDQCHFFAGIGGWALALLLANCSVSSVWTGSCPCQPFSCAGAKKGFSDDRHLWPEFFRLISECKPSIVFGEQVASPDGRVWLARVRSDLEDAGYAVGGADLCAAGVGAPHCRQRLYWVADNDSKRYSKERWAENKRSNVVQHCYGKTDSQLLFTPEKCGTFGGGRVDDSSCNRQYDECIRIPSWKSEQDYSEAFRSGPWGDFFWVPCLDGKKRRVGSGLCCVVDGLPKKMGILRGFGNAIVPQLAAEFVYSFFEARKEFSCG